MKVLFAATSAPSIEIFNISSDHLGTPRVIRRATDGVIVWRWDSDPFGVASPNENPSGAGEFKFNLRFPGQYADAETGLNYNYFRDYNPKTGRYMQSDPIGLEGGTNTYGYALQNPIVIVDPFGLEILLQSHRAFASFNHSKITIIPNNQARWSKDSRFYNKMADGRHYATLGAGPERGYLVSNFNRKRDIQLSHNLSSSTCPLPTRYGSEDELIEALFEIDQKYGDKVTYEFFPSESSEGYNSNSYINGLLRAAGIKMRGPANTPGYAKPLPLMSTK